MNLNEYTLKSINNICKSIYLNGWEDLRQDLFVKILEKERSFDSDQGFLRWCVRVASNIFLDMNRKRSREVLVDVFYNESDDDLNPFDRLAEFEKELTRYERSLLKDYMDSDLKYIEVCKKYKTDRRNSSIEIKKIIKKCRKFI